MSKYVDTQNDFMAWIDNEKKHIEIKLANK